MSRLLLIALLILLTIGVSAQDGLTEEPFRLRQPTVEDYANILDDLTDAWYGDLNRLNTKINASKLTQAVFVGIQATTPNLYELDVDTLKVMNWWFQGFYGATTYKLDWMEAIVLAYVRQNDLDLSKIDEFEALDFEVTVSRYDYNSDEILDPLLEIHSFPANHYIFVDDNINPIRLPLPWFCDCSNWLGDTGSVTLTQVADINADGLTEFVFAIVQDTTSATIRGQFIILQWDGSQFVNVASPDMEYNDTDLSETMELKYEQLNQDEYMDIISIQTRYDTWGCQNFESISFLWDAEANQYQADSSLVEFTETANCALRHGQSAMWDYDYEGAIPLLQKAVQLYDKQLLDTSLKESKIKDIVTKQAYAGVRLALAYMITGQSDKAGDVLSTLSISGEEPIAELVSVTKSLILENPSPLDFCFEMYNVFDRYNKVPSANPYWGFMYEYYIPYHILSVWGPAPNNAKSGCDAKHYLNDVLSKDSFYISDTPLDVFSSIGLPVAQYIKSDLNDDGLVDWLVWFNLERTTPTLFLSDKQKYQVSSTDIEFLQPSEYTAWYDIILPDGQATLVAVFWDDKNTPYDIRFARHGVGGHGVEGYCQDLNGELLDEQFVGGIYLFRLINDQLTQFFEAPICQSVTLDAIFTDESMTQLSAWYGEAIDNQSFPLALVTYDWNDETATYESPSNPISIEEIQPPVAVESGFYLPNSFDDASYEGVIEDTTIYLNTPHTMPLDKYEELIARYHRAFAYQQLGQYDEALADYVMLYTEAPDTAWGMLASLHIEPTNN